MLQGQRRQILTVAGYFMGDNVVYKHTLNVPLQEITAACFSVQTKYCGLVSMFPSAAKWLTQLAELKKHGTNGH